MGEVDTHALPGVALSEFKLRLSGVLLTLIADIAPDDRFVDADGTHETSSSPDPAAISQSRDERAIVTIKCSSVFDAHLIRYCVPSQLPSYCHALGLIGTKQSEAELTHIADATQNPAKISAQEALKTIRRSCGR